MVSGIAFDGLASGLETQEILEQLMEIERAPMRRMEGRREEKETEKAAWGDINSKLSSFQSDLSPLKDAATFESRQVTSSDESTVTAEATSSASEAMFEIEVDQLARAHRAASDYQDVESSDEQLNLSGAFTIEDEEVTIVEEDSLLDIRNKINDTDAGVRASVVDNHLVLNAEKTGQENAIELEDGQDGVLTDLGILDGNDEFKNELVGARDASFSIDGLDITSDTNTDITGVIEGVTLNLHSVSEDPAIVEISHDTDKAVEQVQNFVNKYNEITSKLSDLGRRGEVLAGDGTLRRITGDLRSTAMQDAGFEENDINQLFQVGISIDRHGTMSLDEEEFTEALRENPQEVTDLFSGDDDESGAQGLARRMDDQLQTYLRRGDGLLNQREQMYDRMLSSIDDRMESLERRLEQREESLTRQFVQMEQMLSDLQNQGDWLSGQLGSLPGAG